MSTPEVHIDREEDYRFLHSMLVEKKLHLLFKIHQCLKRFEKRSPAPVDGHAAALASSLADELTDRRWKDEVQELLSLLFKAHLQSLLSVHDAVALRDFEPTLSAVPDDILEEDEDSVKIVSLVKTKDPLGATIKKDESTGAIVVSRIMRGGAADKSGLIHEGDELKEVNGVSLEQRGPKEIPSLLAGSEGEVRLTIVPVYPKQEPTSNSKKLFMRALFDYDPHEDPAVPCKDAAVAFRRGDVLQLVSVQDDTWWQARHLGDADARAGLVPSQELQERRVALQRPDALFKPPPVRPAVTEDVDYGVLTGIHVAGLRRSFRLGRESSWSEEAAQSRRWSTGVHGSIRPPTYLEVIPYHKDPTDPHRLVVLVGPDGVGVNELKKRLLTSNPDHYGVTIPYTTRERRRREKEGEEYHFVSVHMFEEDILNHRFIDSGRYNGHYYGTSLDSVCRVMAEGKVCLLDLNPRNLKQVFTFEFKPFVVFVKPPPIEELRLTRRRATFILTEEDRNSEEDFEEMIDAAKKMESQYGRWFDKVIVNGDVAVAFTELKAHLEKVEKAAVQWIPAEWISSSSTPERRSCSHLGGWI